MKPEIIKKLNQLNLDFYQKIAESFDETRQRPWDGWAELLPVFREVFSGQKSIKVLDIGCGNGRFGAYLAEHLPELEIEYVGIDSNDFLLEKAEKSLENSFLSLQLIKADIISTVTERKTIEGVNAEFDLVIAFGIIHHIPSKELRKQFISYCFSQTKTHGLVAIAAWQFDAGDKMMQRAVTSITVDIAPSELEDRDYILPWERDVQAFRYAHLVKPEELLTLLPANHTMLIQFYADGKEQRSNYYLVMKKN